VPALKASGYPVQFAQWSALFVPAATPDAIVQRLRAAARKVAADPAVVQTISRAGSRSNTSTRPSSRPTGMPTPRG